MIKSKAIRKLIEYKNKKNVEWKQISSEIGFNKHVISRWINGHVDPIKTHEKIIEIFIENNS